MTNRNWILQDHHTHPNYSIDAVGSIDEFCQFALAKGLEEIAVTTHVDTDLLTDDCFVMVHGERVPVQSREWIEAYVEEVLDARDRYQNSGLRILLGAEIDYHPEFESALPDRFFDTDFDVLIGAVHLVDHKAISTPKGADEVFSKCTLQQATSKYYSSLQEAIETGFFDILAHIDLYRRYGEKHFGRAVRSSWIRHVEELARLMKKHDIGFEVNTSPLRKGLDQPMPGEELTQALLQRGVSKITVASDAHCPEDVGAGISQAYAMLRALGVERLWSPK